MSRYLYALRAAFEPSPIATLICFSGTVVTSPAAKIPGTLVRQAQSTIISPSSFNLTKPLANSEFGNSPISIKTPSAFIFLPPLF